MVQVVYSYPLGNQGSLLHVSTSMFLLPSLYSSLAIGQDRTEKSFGQFPTDLWIDAVWPAGHRRKCPAWSEHLQATARHPHLFCISQWTGWGFLFSITRPALKMICSFVTTVTRKSIPFALNALCMTCRPQLPMLRSMEPICTSTLSCYSQCITA